MAWKVRSLQTCPHFLQEKKLSLVHTKVPRVRIWFPYLIPLIIPLRIIPIYHKSIDGKWIVIAWTNPCCSQIWKKLAKGCQLGSWITQDHTTQVFHLLFQGPKWENLTSFHLWMIEANWMSGGWKVKFHLTSLTISTPPPPFIHTL